MNNFFAKTIINLLYSVVKAIQKYKLVMKVIPLYNKIYGFVSEKYEPTSQILFRQKLLEAMSERNVFDINDSKMYKSNKSDKYSPIKEYFTYTGNSKHIIAKAGITYGLNNGYGAYSVHWVRKVQESETWLAPMKLQQDFEFKWKNNPVNHDNSSNQEMLRFVDFIVAQATQVVKETDNMIESTSQKTCDIKTREEFLALLKIARSTKQRIRTALSSKFLEKGNTLFCFSEAIREVGTFEKAVQKKTKRLLIEIGTNILKEKKIETYINDKVDIVLTGKYDWY
ncbi:MAG: hypothetical protein ACPG5B_14340 [Chitinophagales bacterium]